MIEDESAYTRLVEGKMQRMIQMRNKPPGWFVNEEVWRKLYS